MLCLSLEHEVSDWEFVQLLLALTLVHVLTIGPASSKAILSSSEIALTLLHIQ